jgi:hypothetical protein
LGDFPGFGELVPISARPDECFVVCHNRDKYNRKPGFVKPGSLWELLESHGARRILRSNFPPTGAEIGPNVSAG